MAAVAANPLMWNTLEYVALLFAVTAGFSYANHYGLRLPRNSGLLVIALAASLCLRLIEYVFPAIGLATVLRHSLDHANLGPLLLNVFLGFLLFAGALDVDVRALRDRKWTILALATVGVLISTFAMAGGMFGIFRLAGISVPLSYCLVFGALISPTDPVTIPSVLRRLHIPARLEAVISGESLFNDGIGIVFYTVFLHYATSGGDSGVTVFGIFLDFIREACGGILLGLAAGGLAFAAMRGIDEYNIELMISLALVTGTFGIAQSIGVSGPVAVVVAGLLMGSVGVRYAVSRTTHDYLQKFWRLVDELLNSLLFLLIGLEFAAIDLRWSFVVMVGLAIPLSLAVRGLSITMASLPLNLGAPHKLRAITLLTWSGLRGGISVALALSLPPGPYREALTTACYGIVIFTMIVQGLSLNRVASRLYPPTPEAPV
jgi:CPA1 family monovalent cation:H+ antiporter